MIAARTSLSDDAIERATIPAARFIDLVFLPHQMRALLGENLDTLRRTAPRQIEEAIAILSATHLLDTWT